MRRMSCANNQWRDAGATQVAVLVLAKDKLGNTAAELKELAVPTRADAQKD